MRTILTTLLLVLILQTVQAQKSNTDTLHNPDLLDEVTVHENRFRTSVAEQNRNIQIINKEQIARLPVKSVAELLTYVSRVDVRQRGPWGTQADITIDGGTFDETLVLLNGIRVTDPQTGHNMMNLPVTLDVIDHIEILRGAAARVYGINALTGAINIVTQTPKKNGVTITGYAGSNFEKSQTSGNNYNAWGTRATASYVTDKSNHLFSASHDNGNGYIYNTAAHNEKLFYQGKFMTNNTDQLELIAGYSNNNYGANGFYAAPGDKNSSEIVKTVLASLGYQAKINPSWTMRPRLSYMYKQDDYRYITNPVQYRNLHQGHIINAEINNTIQTHVGDFGFGVEAREERILSTNLGKRVRENYGISGEYKTAINRFSFTAGGYLNYNSDYGWQFFPGIDLGYKITEGLKAFANAGTAERLPTYTDLYYSGPANIGNPDLRPETSKYVEGGLKYNVGGFTSSASYFYRRIDHFIDWVKDSLKAPWQPQNFQQINTQGITLNAAYRTKRNDNRDINSFFTNISYTNLNPVIKKPNAATPEISLYALSSLRNQLVGTIGLDFLKAFSATLAVRYNQRIAYTDYTLLDAHIHWQKNRIKIYADATNFTNVNYNEAGTTPMPGKWFTLGASIKLGK